MMHIIYYRSQDRVNYVLGNQGRNWTEASIPLYYNSYQVFLQFEGTVEHAGGPFSWVKGEMAIDDIILTKWSACSDLDRMYNHIIVSINLILYKCFVLLLLTIHKSFDLY